MAAVINKFNENAQPKFTYLGYCSFLSVLYFSKQQKFTIFYCHGKWTWGGHLWQIIYTIVYVLN